MQRVARRILALSLALVLALAVFGCNGEDELTQDEIEQIVADAITANEAAQSLKFDMDMQMVMEMVSEEESAQMTAEVDGTSIVDAIDQEMQIIMNMTMDIPDTGKQDMDMEMYATDGWMYMKTGIANMGEYWMKMELTEEMWQSQAQYSLLIELLRDFSEVRLKGTEDVNGTTCYVIEVVPDMAALFNLMAQQQLTGMQDLDIGEFDVADWFDEFSVKYWIAKDSYLFMKSDINMLMEISAEDVGESGTEKITIDISMTMKCYDYNQPVSIVLPAGAEQAIDMSGM